MEYAFWVAPDKRFYRKPLFTGKELVRFTDLTIPSGLMVNYDTILTCTKDRPQSQPHEGVMNLGYTSYNELIGHLIITGNLEFKITDSNIPTESSENSFESNLPIISRTIIRPFPSVDVALLISKKKSRNICLLSNEDILYMDEMKHFKNK